MGLATYVVGFRPADDRWLAMKAVWDACKVANVEPTREVLDFFGGCEPDPLGVEVKIPVERYCDESREGFEVAVADIPADVKFIRFWNSW